MKLTRDVLAVMPIVDVHCHADVPWQGMQTTAQMMIALAERERLAYTLLLGRDPVNQIPIVRRMSDRFGLMMWVKPQDAEWWAGREKLLLGNRDVVKGIKLHPSVDQYVAGMATLEPVFASANEHDFVIVTHTDETPNSRAGNYWQLLSKYPRTKLVLYHACPLDEALAVIQAFPNVYLDTSYTAFSEAVQRKAAATVGHDKILFGIDAPLGYPIRDGAYLPHARDVVELEIANWFDHDAEAMANVLWRNATRLFGLGVDRPHLAPATCSA